MYNNSKYWINEGKQYQKYFRYNELYQLQEQEIVRVLKNHSFSTVLELGCGFGRITKLLLDNFPDITGYVAVDISPEQLNNASKYVGNDKVTYITKDITKPIFTITEFDLVIACEVLMHIPPRKIDSVIDKMISCSSRHIMNIDFYEINPKTKLAEHNFNHDYLRKYKDKVSWVLEVPMPKVKQSIFHAVVSRAI